MCVLTHDSVWAELTLKGQTYKHTNIKPYKNVLDGRFCRSVQIDATKILVMNSSELKGYTYMINV